MHQRGSVIISFQIDPIKQPHFFVNMSFKYLLKAVVCVQIYQISLADVLQALPSMLNLNMYQTRLYQYSQKNKIRTKLEKVFTPHFSDVLFAVDLGDLFFMAKNFPLGGSFFSSKDFPDNCQRHICMSKDRYNMHVSPCRQQNYLLSCYVVKISEVS